MKKTLLTLLVLLSSLLSFSQSDIKAMKTDSLSSLKGRSNGKYEFYYNNKSFSYGNPTQKVSEFKHEFVVSVNEINGMIVLCFKSGVYALIDEKKNTINLLFTSGSVYSFY